LSFVQASNAILIHAKSSGIKLNSSSPVSKPLPDNGWSIPRQPVAVGPFFRKPIPGDRTQSSRVLSEQYGERKLTLILEGPAGTQTQLPLFVYAPKTTIHADGAELHPLEMHADSHSAQPSQMAAVTFPGGEGWKTITVTLTW
jgi:hypothetical protein